MRSVHGRLAGHRSGPGTGGSGGDGGVGGSDYDLFNYLLLHRFDYLYLFDDFYFNRYFFDYFFDDLFFNDYYLIDGYFLDDFPLNNDLFLYYSRRGRGSAAGNSQ